MMPILKTLTLLFVLQTVAAAESIVDAPPPATIPDLRPVSHERSPEELRRFVLGTRFQVAGAWLLRGGLTVAATTLTADFIIALAHVGESGRDCDTSYASGCGYKFPSNAAIGLYAVSGVSLVAGISFLIAGSQLRRLPKRLVNIQATADGIGIAW
jgi:hypothetical protein